jgi:hypothetical protein
MIGIPVLASERLPEGATAFGLLMSAFAGGNLLGYLLSGSLRRPDGARMRWIVILLFAAFGIVIGSLGFIPYTWIDFALLLLLGLGNGFAAHPPDHLDTDPHSRRDAGTNDGLVDAIQYRADPHLAGNCRRIKQMEPDFSICITGYAGFTDDGMDHLPVRT